MNEILKDVMLKSDTVEEFVKQTTNIAEVFVDAQLSMINIGANAFLSLNGIAISNSVKLFEQLQTAQKKLKETV